MPPRYKVRASVVDITIDQPQPTDRIAVDTNVWAWAHYFTAGTTPSGASIYQAPTYLSYLRRLRFIRGNRYRAIASLAELAHVIEQNEQEA